LVTTATTTATTKRGINLPENVSKEKAMRTAGH
jgi:hypothetical protein